MNFKNKKSRSLRDFLFAKWLNYFLGDYPYRFVGSFGEGTKYNKKHERNTLAGEG
jgi:hypothetical protein